MTDRRSADMPENAEPEKPGSATPRIVGASLVALTFCLGIYWLLDTAQPSRGLIGITFLLVLPAAISAFISYVADPWARRSLSAYLQVPVILVAATCLVSVVFLQEGAICIFMLSPLWLLSGMGGTLLTFHMRARLKRGRLFCGGLMALPILAMQVEPSLPVPEATVTVSRSVVIKASAERIWPLLEGIPDVREGEGRWNVSQDLVGVPRPLGAHLTGRGVGAQRMARWTHGITFREHIVDWHPGHRIGWRFIFEDSDGWHFTDRHLIPDSDYLRVTEGGYTMECLSEGRTRVTLRTVYWMKTPLNGYAALWGELFLGDLEDNILAVVKQRAEKPS